MDTSSPVSALAYAIALCQTNCSNWEGAFKKASQHADELSAKVYYLEMELAAARSHNASLVRENNRLTLSLRHMVRYSSLYMTSAAYASLRCHLGQRRQARHCTNF
jgi:hypothetical protein